MPYMRAINIRLIFFILFYRALDIHFERGFDMGFQSQIRYKYDLRCLNIFEMTLLGFPWDNLRCSQTPKTLKANPAF